MSRRCASTWIRFSRCLSIDPDVRSCRDERVYPPLVGAVQTTGSADVRMSVEEHGDAAWVNADIADCLLKLLQQVAWD